MANVDLTKAVRTILIKNWLDVGKVRLQVAGGNVIIRGRLARSRDDQPVNGLFIEQLEQAIRGTKGVKNVRWILEGWEFDRGQWQTKAD
ncbi:MAG: BON domain-containing protein [Planctomycetota bacterium]